MAASTLIQQIFLPRIRRTFSCHLSSPSRNTSKNAGDSGRAEEIANEAFLKLHSSVLPRQFAPTFLAGLYRTAMNMGIDELRARNRHTPLNHMASTAVSASRQPENGLQLLLRAETQQRVRVASLETQAQLLSKFFFCALRVIPTERLRLIWKYIRICGYLLIRRKPVLRNGIESFLVRRIREVL